MLNILMWLGVIYLALVASSITILAICTSGWYAKKITKMTQDMMDKLDL